MASGLGTRYWRLWSASTLSNLSDGIYQVVLPLVAVTYTRSPILVAAISLVSYLPWLLFALPAGALADRHDRRRLMLVMSGLRLGALVGFGVAVLLGIDGLPLLYALALVMGVAEVLFDTSAQSILPMLVRRDQLGMANARLYAAQEIMNSFAGRAVGGVLIGVSVAVAFLVPAGLCALAVIGLLALRGTYRAVPADVGAGADPVTMREDIAAAVRYLWGQRVLRTLAGMVGGMNLASTAFWSVFVLYAVGPQSPMQLSASVFGLLTACTAAGAVLGSVVVERLQRWLGRARLLTLTVLMNATSLAVPVFTAHAAAVAAGFALAGLGVMVWNVVTVSLRQRIVPDAFLGRVNACYRLVAWGAMPIGAGIGGVLGEIVGLRGTFAFAAVLVLILLIGRRTVTDLTMNAAEIDGDRRTASRT
jgi:MFS family permease